MVSGFHGSWLFAVVCRGDERHQAGGDRRCPPPGGLLYDVHHLVQRRAASDMGVRGNGWDRRRWNRSSGVLGIRAFQSRSSGDGDRWYRRVRVPRECRDSHGRAAQASCFGARVKRHIHIYLITWLGYFGLLILLPVRYGTLQAGVASLSLLLWVAVSVISAYATHHAFASREVASRSAVQDPGRPLEVGDLKQLIALSIAVSLCGLVSLTYDR